MQLHAAAARGEIEGMAFALGNSTRIDARDCSGQTALSFALQRAGGFDRTRGPKTTLETVRFLLDAGASLEAADGLGRTALHHAAAIPDPELLNLLLLRGADPKHVTPSGYSVLLSACYQPPGPAKHRIIERLNEAGCSKDTVSDYGEFPLGVCLRFGDFAALDLLLQLGSDPAPLKWSETHRAVALGSLPDLKRLAPSAATINSKNPRFELSPWLLATMRGDPEIVRWLAERGADLAQSGRCGVAPLHLMAEFGRLEALAWLLEIGADVNAVDDFGSTPLHKAVEGNHSSCAEALLRAGAQGTRQDHTAGQPIQAAKSLEILRLLVEAGDADVNAIDGCGDWPLRGAAEDNDTERIRWLLDHGAKVDLTSTGSTALHAAVGADAREAVALLMGAGANPNAQDVDGWTPLFCAQSREVIRTLLEAGADPTLTDQAGVGPEHWLKDPILLTALRGG